MPVKPHPTHDKTWVIDYSVVSDGKKTYHQIEFCGALKDALLKDRELRQPQRGD